MTYNFGCRNTHGESLFGVLLTEAMVKRVYHGAALRSVVLLLTATAAVGVSSSVQPLCRTETGKSNKKPIQEYIALYVILYSASMTKLVLISVLRMEVIFTELS